MWNSENYLSRPLSLPGDEHHDRASVVMRTDRQETSIIVRQNALRHFAAIDDFRLYQLDVLLRTVRRGKGKTDGRYGDNHPHRTPQALDVGPFNTASTTALSRRAVCSREFPPQISDFLMQYPLIASRYSLPDTIAKLAG